MNNAEVGSRGNVPPEPSIIDAPSSSTDDQPSVLVPADSSVEPTISVVLPTLNEQEGIADCIRQIVTALRQLGEVGEIIVSDSSDDRTPEIAREMGAVVVEPDRPGYGYAYRYAFRHVRGDYVVMGDADTTYDFKELPKLYRLVAHDDADMAIGSRLEGEIKQDAMPPLHQHVGNPLLTKFLNLFYDAGVSDAHSGFRVFTTDALRDLNLRSDGMEFASEMIMRASEQGLTIEERPITYHRRKGEATLESFRDGWRHVKFMLVNAPSYLYLVPGAMLAGVGFSLLLSALFGVRFGNTTPGTYSMIGGSLLVILGYQVGAFWLSSSIAVDAIRDTRDPMTRWITDHFQLEHGAVLGLGMVTFSGILGVDSLLSWMRGGFLPGIEMVVVLLTAAIVGIHTIFLSFFLSMIRE